MGYYWRILFYVIQSLKSFYSFYVIIKIFFMSIDLLSLDSDFECGCCSCFLIFICL